MEILGWLEKWYRKYGITIETIDNPEWIISIDLHDNV